MRVLIALESLAVVAFLAVAAVAVTAGAPALPSIDVEALAVGDADEQWMGIFVQDRHVGYAVSRRHGTADGGAVWQQQSALRIAAMGEARDVVTAATALTDGEGRLVRFDFLLSAPVRVIGRGEVRGRTVHLELVQGGDTQTLDVPVQDVPVVSATLGGVIRGKQLHAGDVFEVPYFDPLTLANAPMTLTVEAPELLPDGETAWWIRTRFGSVETRKLVDGGGDVLREESALGISSVRMTRDEAMAVDGGDPPDLVALASVPLAGPPMSDARATRLVRLRVGGIDVARVPSEPPLQTVDGDVVTIDVPLLAELPRGLPIAGEGDTEPTLTLPAAHPEVVARARDVVGGAEDRLDAARRIHDFVYAWVAKTPTLGVPNGLEVLRSARGDCNEHTALFVTLARAVGIPARIAAGLVYSDRLGDAFYYHAWPEVRLGGPTEWVPVDPTFGEFPADATHLKLVTGDLARQIEIMGVMGKVRLELLEAR